MALSYETDIWQPDPDPWIATLEKSLTELGSRTLIRVHANTHDALHLPPIDASSIREAYHATTLIKAQERNWNKALEQLQALRGYGTNIPPTAYRNLADAITEKWWSEGRLATRAERHAIATYLIGRMRAEPTYTPPDTLEANVIESRHARALEYLAANAAEHITNLEALTRHQIKQAINQAAQSGTSPTDLAQDLLMRFQRLNRDWRRVALTETAQARNDGYLSIIPDGEQIEWSATHDACPICRHHHARTYITGHGDPRTHVWPGKPPTPPGTTPRDWPRIPIHPHCRCRWVRTLKPPTTARADINQLAQELIARAVKFTG